jgi:hypothetical protein
MAFFCTYGSAGLGVHSDVENSLAEPFRTSRVLLQAEHDFPHGPVKILMKNGRALNPPEIVPVRRLLRSYIEPVRW